MQQLGDREFPSSVKLQWFSLTKIKYSTFIFMPLKGEIVSGPSANISIVVIDSSSQGKPM